METMLTKLLPEELLHLHGDSDLFPCLLEYRYSRGNGKPYEYDQERARSALVASDYWKWRNMAGALTDKYLFLELLEWARKQGYDLVVEWEDDTWTRYEIGVEAADGRVI
jgi:hypothetical protein